MEICFCMQTDEIHLLIAIQALWLGNSINLLFVFQNNSFIILLIRAEVLADVKQEKYKMLHLST